MASPEPQPPDDRGGAGQLVHRVIQGYRDLHPYGLRERWPRFPGVPSGTLKASIAQPARLVHSGFDPLLAFLRESMCGDGHDRQLRGLTARCTYSPGLRDVAHIRHLPGATVQSSDRLALPNTVVMRYDAPPHAAVVKLVDTRDLKSLDRKVVPVRFRPAAPLHLVTEDLSKIAVHLPFCLSYVPPLNKEGIEHDRRKQQRTEKRGR